MVESSVSVENFQATLNDFPNLCICNDEYAATAQR
jgi:hypothetical protein